MPTRNSIALAPEVLHNFDTANPVDFNLHDDEGQQHIYILNDQSPGRTHHLVLFNHSGQDIFFQKPGNHTPDVSNHHFEIRFRPGTLDPDHLSWLNLGTAGWRMSTSVEELDDKTDLIHDRTVSLYLLYVGGELTLKHGSAQVVILHLLKAAIPGGSRGSRVELRYYTDGTELFTTPNGEMLHKRQERLQIINQRGKKELPMMAAFEGSSTVLNNGETANQLILQVSNFLQNSTIPLHGRDHHSPSKFILSFDTSEEQAAWALCDGDNAAAIDVEVHFEAREGVDWHIRPQLQGNNPQWVITLDEELPLGVNEYFHLHLDGLKTSMPSGFTTLYLLYENIPGFWDGRFEIPIEKSPLKFDDEKEKEDHRSDGRFVQKTKVGIGNLEPEDTLDVNGGLRAETMVLRNGKAANLALDVKGKTNAWDANVEGKFSTKDLEITGSLKVAGTLQDDLGHFIPPGGIIMWSGKTVPEGWKLCDGKAGTPDLRGRFIVGYPNHPSEINRKDNYSDPGNYSEEEKPSKWKLGNTGGKKEVELEIEQIPGHRHTINHGHTIKDPGHSHDVYANNKTGDNNGLDDAGNAGAYWSKIKKNVTGITVNDFKGNSGISGNHDGLGNQKSGQPHENRPPYYVLAFIMKK